MVVVVRLHADEQQRRVDDDDGMIFFRGATLVCRSGGCYKESIWSFILHRCSGSPSIIAGRART